MSEHYEDDMDGFTDDIGEQQGVPIGFLPAELETLSTSQPGSEEAWEVWSDVLGPTYSGVLRKLSMLEYFVDLAKGAARHAISCPNPACEQVRRPVTLCDDECWYLALALDGKRFQRGAYADQAALLLATWRSRDTELLQEDPRYILFSATYNIILIQAAIKRDSVHAPTFGGQ